MKPASVRPFRIRTPLLAFPVLIAVFCACDSPPFSATVDSPTVTGITATSATLGGNAVNGGEDKDKNAVPLSARGVVYSKTADDGNPTIGADGVTKMAEGGTAAGTFTVAVTGLEPGTEYSFKAYADGQSAGYTEVGTFTTDAPGVSSPTSTDITTSSATLGGDITDDVGLAISERGVVVSATSDNDNPFVGGTKVTRVTHATATTGIFTVSASGLAVSTAYTFKAYVTAGGFTFYSDKASFTTPSEISADGLNIFSTASLPDGKTLVGGDFTSLGGEAYEDIARLNADGTVDTSFTASVKGGGVTCIVVQGDGKIIVGGNTFNELNGVALTGFDNNVARFNADGTTDTSFNVTADGIIDCIALQPDGKIILGGSFLQINGTNRFWLGRINSDGTLDNTFNPGDPFSSPDSVVYNVLVQPDGKILIGGEFSQVHGTSRVGVARLNNDGSLDTTFDPGTGATGTGPVRSLSLFPSGKIIIAGWFDTYNGTARNGIARLNSDGSLDTAFDPGTGAETDTKINSVTLQSDFSILVGGSFTTFGGEPRKGVARLTIDGSLDDTFDPDFGFPVRSLGLLPNGEVLIGGEGSFPSPGNRELLVEVENDDALTSLTVPDLTKVQWLQGGAGPEFSRVTFDVSTDGGTSWTSLGVASRNLAGWELTGLSLPASGSVRARGRTLGGNYGGSSGLVEAITDYPIPIVTDPASSGLTATEASIGGTVATGGPAITERGVVYALTADNPDPFIGGASVIKVTAPGTTGLFTVPLTGLAQETEYSFRAYAINSQGTGYSSSATFSTLVVPRLIQRTLTNITATEAEAGAKVSADGGSPITERGIVYSRTADNEDPLIDGPDTFKIVEGDTSLGIFTAVLSDLAQGTTFTFKAYATSSFGTGYTTAGTFTTLGAPKVILPTVTSVTNTSAQLGGTVQTDGGSAITFRGVGYIITSEIEEDKLVSDQDKGTRVPVAGTTGTFTTNVSGLTPGTDYSFLAFAENEYGSDFTTPLGTFTTTGVAPGAPAAGAPAAGAPAAGTLSGGATPESGDEETGPPASSGLPTGTVDDSFVADVQAGTYVQAIAVQPDGKTIIGGTFFEVGGVNHSMIARLNADGSVDPSFDTQILGPVNNVLIQPDGKILIGGSFSKVNERPRNGIARLNPDGTVEKVTSFSPGAAADAPIYAVALQPDGKILIGGLFETFQGVDRKGIVRLKANGILDPTFDPGAGTDASVFSIALQPDGGIVIGGGFENVDGTSRNRIARLHPDGSLDTGFDPNGGADDFVTSVAVQSDGKIVAAGYFTTMDSAPRSRIARLLADGAHDTTFDPGSGASDHIYSLATQIDGKILIGGIFQSVDGTARNRIARLDADGSHDTTFDPGTGADDEVDAVALQEDGSILVGGIFQFINGTARNGIARLANEESTASLSLSGRDELTWLRGGAGPEICPPAFEISEDGGTTWNPLGTGGRIAGGWQLSEQDLPVGGMIRSVGTTAGGFLGSSSGLVEDLLTFDYGPQILGLRAQLRSTLNKIRKEKRKLKRAKKSKNRRLLRKSKKKLRKLKSQQRRISKSLAAVS